jgi:hypothetical protein
MFSFTPPTRAASICTTSTAPACNSCLKTTLLAMCSPVATLIGASARRTEAWPSTSSGEVGSSIQYGAYGASRLIHSTAGATSQRWLASTAIRIPSPTVSRATRIRRTSSSTDAPTFSLIWVKPSATASRASRASFSSE